MQWQSHQRASSVECSPVRRCLCWPVSAGRHGNSNVQREHFCYTQDEQFVLESSSKQCLTYIHWIQNLSCYQEGDEEKKKAGKKFLKKKKNTPKNNSFGNVQARLVNHWVRWRQPPPLCDVSKAQQCFMEANKDSSLKDILNLTK